MKPFLLVFSVAFVLNLLWENLHSLLYTAYKGGEITQFILFRASLFDAFLIACVATPFLVYSRLQKHAWVLAGVLLCVAIVNEWYGLNTNRWEYNEMMPIVSIVKTGLTPTIQLSVLGILSYRLVKLLK